MLEKVNNVPLNFYNLDNATDASSPSIKYAILRFHLISFLKSDQNRLEPSKVARVGTTATMFGALIYSLLWTSEEIPNAPTLLSFMLIYFGEQT